MNKKTIFILVFSLLIIAAAVAAYFLLNPTDATTIIFVAPDRVVESTGQDFTVNISISNVLNLYAWECRFGWNATVLDLVNVTEGPFLNKAGQTFFNYGLNETFGRVVIDCTLLGNLSGVDGNGVLTSIRFHVKNEGTCELVLFDTKFVDASEQTIAHTVKSGRFSDQ